MTELLSWMDGSDLPDPEVCADWIELAAYLAPERGVSRTDLADILSEEGILEGGDRLDGFDEYSDGEVDLSDSDATNTILENVWNALRRRSAVLGSSYPFDVKTDTARFVPRESGSSEYIALLAVDLSQKYEAAKLTAFATIRLLFEKITAVALRGLFGDPVCILGTSGGDIATADLNARIEDLCDIFDIPFRPVDHEVTSDDKDLGLDVVCRLGILDERPGSVYFLVQCTTSVTWDTGKRGEPSGKLWSDLVSWDGMLVPAVAIPFRVSESKRLTRACKRMNLAIFDRFRLARGLTSSVDPDSSKEVEVWLREHTEKFPRTN